MKCDQKKGSLYTWMMVQHREISVLWKLLKVRTVRKMKLDFQVVGKSLMWISSLPTSNCRLVLVMLVRLLVSQFDC